MHERERHRLIRRDDGDLRGDDPARHLRAACAGTAGVKLIVAEAALRSETLPFPESA